MSNQYTFFRKKELLFQGASTSSIMIDMLRLSKG